jgi:hypothetical protein
VPLSGVAPGGTVSIYGIDNLQAETVLPRGRCSMTGPLREEGLEPHRDDVVLDPEARLSEHIDKGNKVEQRHLGFAEGYVKGGVRIELRGRFLPVEITPRHWRALFEEFSVDRELGRLAICARPAPVHTSEVEHSGKNDQQPVLVNVVELVETEQRATVGVCGFSFSSAVWLDFFEQIEDSSAANTRRDVGAKQVTLLVEGRFADGELRALPRSPAVECHKLPRKVVQGGAEVVEELADDEAPLGWYGGSPCTVRACFWAFVSNSIRKW